MTDPAYRPQPQPQAWQQPPAQYPQQPLPPQGYGYQQPPQQARSGAQYVRQQTGHSITKHLLFGALLLWIPTIYYALSPNHYFHA